MKEPSSSSKLIDQGTPKAKRGTAIVIALGGIFFTLLGLLIFVGRSQKDRPAEKPSVLYVVPTGLRVRAAPSPTAEIITTVERGQKLELLETRGSWVRIQAPDGSLGWSERSYLEGEAEHARRTARVERIRELPPLDGVVEKRTPLYAGPGIFYPVVGQLEPPSRVQIFTRDHDFFAVEAGGEIVYADVDAIRLTTPPGGAQLEVAEREQPEFPGYEPPDSPMFEPEPLPPAFEPPPATSAAGRVYPEVPAGGTAPAATSRSRPRYPLAARRAGIEGSVVIRAIVRGDGSVDNVEVIQNLPHGLGDAAREAVAEWRFRPATYRGEPIDVFYTVTVNFRLR
ncbi:MAG TPA: TonB family protein [Thermoanaerobaculia bacterium]|nr:TonB family protein [Thermoanaerobaculia bacterium]